MNHTEQKQAAKKFVTFWQKYKEGQNEIQITQKFWLNKNEAYFAGFDELCVILHYDIE